MYDVFFKILGTLRSTTLNSTTTSSKQKDSSRKTKRINNFKSPEYCACNFSSYVQNFVASNCLLQSIICCRRSGYNANQTIFTSSERRQLAKEQKLAAYN